MGSSPVLVTGAAGFIGYHTASRLLAGGSRVVGVDNLNDYYDVSLKKARVSLLNEYPQFRFVEMDIADRQGGESLFGENKFRQIIHLAAQAGVRYSLTNPDAYVSSNLVGFVNLMEGARRNGVEHVVYASSSSVYGANTKVPFCESDRVDHPVSLYAATKKSNELIAHSYSHLFDIAMTGLRFFTVYGPFGRPDMAIFKFTKAILSGTPLDVYNNGDVERDFTYVDDIVEGLIRTLDAVPEAERSADEWTSARYRVMNIGGGHPVPVLKVISILEGLLGKKAVLRMLPMQPGDVYKTFASTELFSAITGYRAETQIEAGLEMFVRWYLEFYKCKCTE
ncbi:MAG: SDR family NAD(P)-dependent oxidoreductase [Terracidiphilus sp.]|nr:SDR family NAD(P)-dependent oxidoreductase [Terracidiphilus sp.]